ncbi:chemotaxis protein CheW [Pseudomonas sp. MWU16-30317]|jgi:chemosensory pili system protein ChpC|uniref:chemotaxis protein CheW n=1 Tax=Pseudomonas sp. MWU16-30317 TaxID=2878095 RepID=UPI001CFBCF1A|nr:chemotaxis protein CheW [Pseudomonas sp. MWU16-30317]
MPDFTSAPRTTLTTLMLPLADRSLVLPNVAVAELIDYQLRQPVRGAPVWHLGMIVWRELQIPLVSFEAACGAPVVVGEDARIVVLNCLSDGPLQFMAILIQAVPRSCKVDSQLSYVDVPLAELELAAVQISDRVAKIPDLDGLERLLLSY